MPDSGGAYIALASAARGGAGNAEIPSPPYLDKLTLYLMITAISGTATPTMDMVLEQLDPASGTWALVAGGNICTAQSATTSSPIVKTFNTDAMRGRLRLRWTQGGTNPVFTFSVGAIAGRAR
jgi:hypothetical protein